MRPPFFARLSDAGLDAVAQYVVFELSENCQHPCQDPPLGVVRSRASLYETKPTFTDASFCRVEMRYVLPPAAQACRRPTR